MFRKPLVALLAGAGLFFFATAEYWVKQATPPPAVEVKSTPDRLWIVNLGIAAPIVYVEHDGEEVFQEALQRGTVHYPGTAGIGEPGNAYLFGHSADFIWASGNYKTVFALLPKIKIGDEVTVTDREGNVYRYKVIETKVVKPDDLSVLSQYNYERKLLTLQTSYPVGTAWRRFAAVAELVEE